MSGQIESFVSTQPEDGSDAVCLTVLVGIKAAPGLEAYTIEAQVDENF